jgi:malonyl-CoA O-methyltransferase
MAEPVDTQSGYDRWSEVYDHDQNPLVLLEEPLVQRWLADVAGLTVADVGCGTGRHARWLAESGARVVALDFSSGMLEAARRKLADLGVEVRVHALPAPLPDADGRFDVVLFALVADHIADLDGTFRELARVTRPGGRVIFTVLHPAMNLRGVTARFTDPVSGDTVHVAAYEHRYADYLMAVLRAGLTIDEIVEDRVDDALAERTPRAEKYRGWPMLLALRLRRPV